MDLAVPSFLIAIVGIVLQLADAFPEHRETRKTVVIMSIGFFAGAIGNGVFSAKYNITGDFSSKYAILFALAFILFVFGLLATLLSDDKKRDNASVVAGGAAILFLLTGFAVAMSGIDRDPVLSTDELLVLAKNAESHGQYEHAVDLNRQLKARLPSGADAEIQNRIDILEQQQVGLHSDEKTMSASKMPTMQ